MSAPVAGKLPRMAPLNSAEILKQWRAAINGHAIIALAALMAVDFVFVDSLANRVDSAKSMEAGWRGYFALCPDYWIHVDEVMSEGNTMLIAGEAGGTIDGSVVEWRVFADNKPVYEILGRRRQ